MYFLEIGSLYKIASRIERLVVPVDLTMVVFCKRLHSVHHVRLSNTVRHVVLLEVLLGEVERCDVLAAGAFATAAVFWELVPTRHSQVWASGGSSTSLAMAVTFCCVAQPRSTTWSHDCWLPVSIASAKTVLIAALPLLQQQ